MPTKRVKVSLIKVKSCRALLLMQLVCICGYLKSVLRYQFLILDTSQPDNPYFREQVCEDPWLFFDGSPRANKFGIQWPSQSAKIAMKLLLKGNLS